MYRLDFTKFWVFQNASYVVTQYLRTPMPEEHKDMILKLREKFNAIWSIFPPDYSNFRGKTYSIYLSREEAIYYAYLLQHNIHRFPKLAALQNSLVEITALNESLSEAA